MLQSALFSADRRASYVSPVSAGLPVSRTAPRRLRGSYQLTEFENENFPSSMNPPARYSNFGSAVRVCPSFTMAAGLEMTDAFVAEVRKLSSGSAPTTVPRAPVLNASVRCGLLRSA